MSSISITFHVQALDFSPLTRGRIEIGFTLNGTTTPLRETLSLLTSTYLTFQEVAWASGQETALNAQQAVNFRNAFNRDHSNVSGGKNLVASVTGNVVTITAKVGTFSSFDYNGNVLVISENIDNTVQPIANTFGFAATSTGDCLDITYRALAASGGTAPYRLNLLDFNFVSGWDGNADVDFVLKRGRAYTGALYDSSNAIISNVQILTPRRLQVGDISQTTLPGIGFSDVTVNVVNIVGIGPLEYKLGDSAWQSSNVFGGVLSGNYDLIVRDRFGCEVTKTINVVDFQLPTESEVIRYLRISNFNSLAFAERVQHGIGIRKNYENTLSHEEALELPYQSTFEFPQSSRIKTQFKSSYPIHVVSLLKSDGTKQSLPIVQTQENIGTIERVDCNIFPLVTEFQQIGGGTLVNNNGIGVYFNGGNRYEPNTSTVTDGSPYEGGLPEWAKQGNYVSFAGIGTKEILATDLYDEVRGVLYFQVSGTIAAEVSEIVQATFNRHPYNVYRCDFDMSLVDHYAKVVIEAGFSFDEIERRFDSEVFEVLTDASKHLKITVRSDRNFDDMIFSDGIDCEMWVKGKIRPFPIGSSDTRESDDRTRSLKQRHRMAQRLTIPILSSKQWHKLGLWCGVADDGEFRIEDMQLVVTEPLDAEEVGNTNLSNVTAEFAYGGENLSVKADEVILNPSTGVVGTAQTGKEQTEDPIEIRLLLEDGTYLQTGSGYYIALG